MFLMPRKGQKGRYNYGKSFDVIIAGSKRKVAYRYTNRKKSTKTLVDFKSKKPLNMERRSRRYKK